MKEQLATSKYVPCDVIRTALDIDGKWEKGRENQYIELKKMFETFETKWDTKLNRPVYLVDTHGNKVKREFIKGNIIHKFVATISSLILWPLPFGLHLEKVGLSAPGDKEASKCIFKIN